LIRNRAGAVAALGLIAVGAVAGCGGSSSTSKEDFAKKADQVCADTQARVTELSKTNPKGRSELMQYIERLKATANEGVQRLKAIDPPSGDAGKTAKQFTGTLEQQYVNEVVPALDQLRKAVDDRDKEGLKTASKKLQAIDDTVPNRLATQLGAKGCGQSQ
jgi:Tfp pilus assembly protein PilP